MLQYASTHSKIDSTKIAAFSGILLRLSFSLGHLPQTLIETTATRRIQNTPHPSCLLAPDRPRNLPINLRIRRP